MKKTNMQVELNVNKINKDKIIERTYRNKEGQDVTEKIYKFRVVRLKSPKVVASGDNWVMKKVGFCVEKKDNKEEPDNFVGSVMEFDRDINGLNAQETSQAKQTLTKEQQEIDASDIPF